MKYKTLLVILTTLIALLFTSCSSPPPPFTREQCGPYPEDYATIAREYATKTKILRATKPGFTLTVEVNSSAPEISNDRLHPGWLVRSQRKLTETLPASKTSPSRRNEIQLPFSIIIYDGKVVWTSDEQHGVKLN